MQDMSMIAGDPTAPAPEAVHLERRPGTAECGETGGPFGALAEVDCGECLARSAARHEADARAADAMAAAARSRLSAVNRDEDASVVVIEVGGRLRTGTLRGAGPDASILRMTAALDFVARIECRPGKPVGERWAMSVRRWVPGCEPAEQQGELVFRRPGVFPTALAARDRAAAAMIELAEAGRA